MTDTHRTTFHLPFEIMTNDKFEAARTGNWCLENDLAIAPRQTVSQRGRAAEAQRPGLSATTSSSATRRTFTRRSPTTCARSIETRILAAIRAAGLDSEQRLSPEELGALDHFHTGGLAASRVLLELARIRPEDRVLDIGAGLAGPARMLASTLGCRVDCLEMSPDFCAGAVLLNRLTGLGDRIEVHRGSALDLPFSDDSFDVVWMQNVGMNIADKQKLYGEIYRVLESGGRFAFQEMAAGEAPASYFPLPWASDPADNFLVSVEEMRSLLEESGFIAELLEDTSAAHLSGTTANATPAAPGTLGLAVYVDNLAQKAGNARRSLEEGQVRLVRGAFRVN